MPQIYDMGPTALLPLRGFFRPKNPTASAGFEPANLGTKGQHATPRPPKPILLYTLTKWVTTHLGVQIVHFYHLICNINYTVCGQ